METYVFLSLMALICYYTYAVRQLRKADEALAASQPAVPQTRKIYRSHGRGGYQAKYNSPENPVPPSSAPYQSPLDNKSSSNIPRGRWKVAHIECGSDRPFAEWKEQLEKAGITPLDVIREPAKYK